MSSSIAIAPHTFSAPFSIHRDCCKLVSNQPSFQLPALSASQIDPSHPEKLSQFIRKNNFVEQFCRQQPQSHQSPSFSVEQNHISATSIKLLFVYFLTSRSF
jgi:hypothetical protein